MRLLLVLLIVSCSGVPPVGSGAGGAGGAGGSAAGGGSATGGGGATAGGGAGGGGTASGGGFVDAGDPPLTSEELSDLAARPYRLVIPDSYDGGTAVPFIVLLHGYSATGLTQDVYFKMTQLAQAKGFLLATPDGLIDISAEHYWNATDACCGTPGTVKTDDVAYLTAILDDVRLRFHVDPKRVYFVGHSNGAFMSHRMACDRASRVAAIVSLAGEQWNEAARCQASEAVSVLQVHGTADAVIPYAGGNIYGTPFPGTLMTIADWQALNGCATTLSDAGTDLDLDSLLPGAETHREKYDGCPAGGAVELWTLDNGSHVPTFTDEWGPDFYDWLMAHPKP